MNLYKSDTRGGLRNSSGAGFQPASHRRFGSGIGQAGSLPHCPRSAFAEIAHRAGERGRAGFTMIEIALALAVIGFALVAIIGVLPMGLEVQRQNREDTIIDHDGNYLMDTLRSGVRNADGLTNAIFEIRHNRYDYSAGAKGTFLDSKVYTVDGKNSKFDNAVAVKEYPLTNSHQIIGLLGRPKYTPATNASGPDGFISNNIIAYARALSGSATEKNPQRNSAVQDLAFSYRITSEIVPVPVAPYTNVIDVIKNAGFEKNLQANLHEVRLLYRWPVSPRGQPGPSGREVFRTQVGGRSEPVKEFDQTLYFFEPSLYSKQ